MHADTSLNMNVGDICRRNVTTVTAHTTLVDAARLLCDTRVEAIVAVMTKLQSSGVECAPVVGQGGTLCGAISQRDLLLHRLATE